MFGLFESKSSRESRLTNSVNDKHISHHQMSDNNGDEISKSPPSTRSYLPDDKLRREFCKRFESAPRSSNFVKQLVSELEHANNNQLQLPIGTARPPRRPVPLVPVRSSTTLGRTKAPARIQSSLEELPEEKSSSSGSSSSCKSVPSSGSEASEQSFTDFEEIDYEAGDDEDDYVPVISAILPSRPSSSSEQQHHQSSGRVKKSIKQVISSMMGGWKPAKGLPKGNRESYYATRESLGEEMRQFRQNTMPKLMKHRFVDIKDEEQSPAAQHRENSSRQQSFVEAIDGNRAQRLSEYQEIGSSIATIHPVYGCKPNRADIENRLSAIEDPGDEPIYRKIEEIAAASRAALNDAQTRNRSPQNSIYLTPSVRSPPKTSSTTIYDVPRRPRPISSGSMVSVKVNPDYANIGPYITGVDQDQRLRCRTSFTSF